MDFIQTPTFEIFCQLLLAVLLGTFIGVEREFANKFAGMRTHALVAMGSALFTIASTSISTGIVDPSALLGLQIDGVAIVSDPTRIAAQIVTGIGFLGAGLIVFHRSRVQGLTTAAGVWVAAAIGMAVGFQLYLVAIFASILTVLVFILLWPLERKFVVRFSGYTDGDEQGDR